MTGHAPPRSSHGSSNEPGPVVVARQMTSAVTAWLGSLSPAQLGAAVHPGPRDPGSRDRLNWYYTPTDHGGLSLAEQSPAQQRLAMQVLSAGLSYEGYVTVCTIIGTENILDRVEQFSVDWGRERGRDPQLFWLRIFGDPERDDVWAWRFAGHHVSLNYVVADGAVVSTTPSFLGLDPAETPLLGSERLRPLGGCEDLARELLHALTPEQQGSAVLLDRAVSDIVSGNRARISDGDQMIHVQDLWRGRFVDERLVDALERVDQRVEAASGFDEHDHFLMSITDDPKGLPASAMTAGQRDRLRTLLSMFHGRLPAAMSAAYQSFYASDAELDRVHFAWGGPRLRGQQHYWRVQGPRLLVEYDNTQRDGNHAHSVWRDPVSDFGLDLLAAE